MANNDEELKKEVARLHRQYEAEIPRLTDLSVAVIGAFESNDASPTEVSAVCLDLMLQAIGHIFGDTKADILAEGISQLLTQLRGMFAFCLWDDAVGVAWIARDRLGVKPLFYSECGGSLTFASTVRALERVGYARGVSTPAIAAASTKTT